MLFFYCAFQNSCSCTTLLCLSLYRAYCHFPVLPQFFLLCPTFWVQDLPPFSFQHFFFYCILFSILYTLHPCYVFPPFFFLFPVSCFLAKVTPHIFHFSFKKKSLFLIFMGLNPLVFIFSTLYIGCYCLLCNPSPLK